MHSKLLSRTSRRKRVWRAKFRTIVFELPLLHDCFRAVSTNKFVCRHRSETKRSRATNLMWCACTNIQTLKCCARPRPKSSAMSQWSRKTLTKTLIGTTKTIVTKSWVQGNPKRLNSMLSPVRTKLTNSTVIQLQMAVVAPKCVLYLSKSTKKQAEHKLKKIKLSLKYRRS